jgi:hypothetical protein
MIWTKRQHAWEGRRFEILDGSTGVSQDDGIDMAWEAMHAVQDAM